MKKIVFAIFFLVSTLFGRYVSVPVINTDSGIINLSMSINGENIQFHDFPGKYVLLEYFGAHCPVCKSEVKHMKIINKENPLIKVVAVEVQGTPDSTLKDFIFERGISFPVVSFNNSIEFYYYARAGVPNWGGRIPMMVLFATNGKKIKSFTGLKTEEDIMKALNEYRKGR